MINSDCKTKIFVWGASGHALFVRNILSYHNDIEVVGVLDDVSPQRKGENFHGVQVLGGREILPFLKKHGVVKGVFGFGSCSARLHHANFLYNEGFELISAIHPMAVVSTTASIGAGCVVGPGVVIDAECKVEENCILNNNSCISHGTYVASGTHICPGVTIGGDVSIGRGSWIGIGSTVVEKITIGAGSYIGAGSVVIRDVPDNVLVYGTPAKVIRSIPHTF